MFSLLSTCLLASSIITSHAIVIQDQDFESCSEQVTHSHKATDVILTTIYLTVTADGSETTVETVSAQTGVVITPTPPQYTISTTYLSGTECTSNDWDSAWSAEDASWSAEEAAWDAEEASYWSAFSAEFSTEFDVTDWDGFSSEFATEFDFTNWDGEFTTTVGDLTYSSQATSFVVSSTSNVKATSAVVSSTSDVKATSSVPSPTTLTSKFKSTSIVAPPTTTSTTPQSTSSTVSSTAATSAADTFESSMLAQHNVKRALHKDTAPLSWSKDLQQTAQSYADAYDCSGILTHSGKPYGENLALGYPLYDGKTGIYAWYDEINYYNYANPGFSESTGHFTQVVWKGTSQVGCGYKKCNNEWGVYLVCNYLAPGNFIGQFAENVEPLIN